MKSKKKSRTIEVEKVAIPSTSIDSMEEEKDFLDQEKFICKEKQKKKGIRIGEQKNKIVLTNEGEKEQSKDPGILEDQTIDEKALKMKVASEVKKDNDFSKQNDCINLTMDDDKVKAKKKSRRKKCKTGNKGQDEETVTRKENFEVEHRRKMVVEEEEETSVVLVEKEIEFVENEVELVRETIKIRKSESKDCAKAVSNEEGIENRLVEEPDDAIGKRKKEKKKKKKKVLYDSEEEETFMQKGMKIDDNCDTKNDSDFCSWKETEERGMKRDSVKNGNEAILDATSVGDGSEKFIKNSLMAHMKGNNDRQGDNLSLGGHNLVKSSEEKCPLNGEKSLANKVIKYNEESEDRKTEKSSRKNRSHIDKKRVFRNTKEDNENESVQEMQQDIKLGEIVKEENAVHGTRRYKCRKAKTIGSSNSDFESRHVEEGAKESAVCSEKDSDDECQALNRRSRRQRMRAVNYADEFDVEDGDDEEFYPHKRKPRRSKVDKKSIEQKSNGERCSQKRMESRQVNENGRKERNKEESIVHFRKGPSEPVVEDSDVNLSNKKALGEGSQESIQLDSQNTNLPG